MASLDVVSTRSPGNEVEPPPPFLPRLADGVRRHWVRLVRSLLLAVGLAVGGWMVPGAPFLTVDDIVVHGNEQLSAGEVLALMPGLRGAPILSVDLDEHRRRLSASPWLTGGTLRRRLPSTVEVFVTERRPVALGRFDGRLFLLDASGAVVDGYGPRFAHFDFPIVDGLEKEGGEGASVVDPERMALAARLLADLAGRPDLLDAVSEIDVADSGNAVVLLDDDVALLHLGAERFVPRLRLYTELAPLLRKEGRDIDAVDLRFDPRVYVRDRAQGRGSAGPEEPAWNRQVADTAPAGRSAPLRSVVEA